jgi:hypothetical protein
MIRTILDDICDAIRVNRYRITEHASVEMENDDLAEPEVLAATAGGELIEDYPTSYPYPACLALGQLSDGGPLHVVWAFEASSGYAVLVTTYKPNPARWSADFRRRLKP